MISKEAIPAEIVTTVTHPEFEVDVLIGGVVNISVGALVIGVRADEGILVVVASAVVTLEFAVSVSYAVDMLLAQSCWPRALQALIPSYQV